MNTPSHTPGHTDEWYNDQYDPRKKCRPLPEIVAEWMLRSREFRHRYGNFETVRYGVGEREVFDFYRAPDAKGILAFFHGGYWRSGSKDEHAWIAESFVNAGLSVAVMNYPLCPQADLPEIIACARVALSRLYHDVATQQERSKMVVTGHSAGGYHAASLAVKESGIPANAAVPISAVVTISGIFDLMPLTRTLMNEWLRLTPSLAAELNLMLKRPSAAEFILAYGGLESDEFARQSRDLCRAWGVKDANVLPIPGKNHFDVLDDFALSSGDLNRRILETLTQRPKRSM